LASLQEELSPSCLGFIGELLEIDQLEGSSSFGGTYSAGVVGADSSLEVRGHTDIEISILHASEHVDTVAML